MRLYAGTSGFAYKEWRGNFYPEKLPPNEMLGYYAERLGAVEINYTFHHMPTVKLLDVWGREVGEDFRFAFKAPMRITHLKRLKDVGEEADYFFRTLGTLGEKLGAALFQFPPTFPPNPQRLADFMELIPEKMSCAFEFRHAGWSVDEEVRRLLTKRGHALCVADTDEFPAGEVVSTASWGYVRLRRTAYSDADLVAWVRKIRAQGWGRAFVFFKHEDEADGPSEAARFFKLARESSSTTQP